MRNKRFIYASVLVVACSAYVTPKPVRSTAITNSPRALFSFHVDFWINLDEVLYHETLLPRPGYDGTKSLRNVSVATMALDEDDAARWKSALGYYGAHFTSGNTFAPDIIDGTRRIVASRSEDAPSLDLATEWRESLARAAPVYRAKLWPAHEREDRAYIDALQPEIATHGEWMARRLEAVYQTAWPTKPIDVEVAPAVPPFGASTVGEPPFSGEHEPLIIVSSKDPGYRGDSGLEMIFHEASHLLVDKVEQALDASAKRQGRQLPDRFWHLLLFYTAGHLMRERLGESYVPYAERATNTIFVGRFAASLPVLARAWQPYLDGRVDLASAIDSVVASF